VAARDIERRLQDPFFLPKALPEQLASRELHHRVKNDLELLRALLSLQAGKIESTDAREAIATAANRVGSLVDLYETLHRSGEYRDVTTTELLAVLLPSLQEKASSEAVTITGDAEPCTVIPVHLARTASIVINELTTNALKHGLQSTEHLLVEIRLEQRLGQLEITVRDTGPGYPPTVLRSGGSGFGLEIVRCLALQHGGSLDIENESGALARLSLPVA
jgi:two-component sensor histidine kinase